MLDFKLISVDDHVNEHPAAWERARREFGDRVPHIVETPPDLGRDFGSSLKACPLCAPLTSL